MESLARYPLNILPTEIWEMIILEVKDSEDLRNLMKASKQLNDSFSKIHHLWLLDKVLPLLTTTYKKRYLEIVDVKKLRLVDKRWCGAVNTFLENQPYLRPYNKDDDKVNSEAHIWDDTCLKYPSGDSSDAAGTAASLDHDLMKKLSDNFKNPKGNPFLSRSIVGWTQPDTSDEYEDDPLDEKIETFWGAMNNKVFKIFGKDIWYLSMMWFNFGAWQQESLWRRILISLSSLANLKSLDLNIMNIKALSVQRPTAHVFLQSENNQLPPLPFLESLMINRSNSFTKLFSQQLLSKYFTQLRRLQISIIDWDVKKRWTFPNLTEFHLDDINASKKVTQVLESLEAPQLAKLELEGSNDDDANLKIEKIFSWLTLFPSLLHLDISCEMLIISESGALKSPQDSMPSLKYLKIHNSSGVNYNFLRCLPNLQRLQISLDEEPVVWDCSAYPDIRIKLELETCSIYQSNIWELCPKLRTLSLCYKSDKLSKDCNHHDEFDRQSYEKLKNTPSELRERTELRSDIAYFLGLKESDSGDEQEEEDDDGDDEEHDLSNAEDEQMEESEDGSD